MSVGAAKPKLPATAINSSESVSVSMILRSTEYKPSEITPLNAFVLAEILEEAGAPAGVFNLVTGLGPVVGEAMAASEDIDMISFTGSTRAGRRVSEVAAATVKRVALELGGKSPNVILEDADLQAALARAEELS